MPVKGPTENAALERIRRIARAAIPNVSAPAPGRADGIAERLSQAADRLAVAERLLDKSA